MGRLIFFCLVAGSCDALTGVLLVSAPAFTLGLMGISTAVAEPVFLRFVGVFVGSIGLSYLYPWVLHVLGHGARTVYARVRTVFEVTAMVRLAVAAFVGASVLGGVLEAGWAGVAVTDFAFAAVQLGTLRRWPEEVAG